MGLRASDGTRTAALTIGEGGKVQLSREEFALLLGGTDLTQTRPPPQYIPCRRWKSAPLRRPELDVPEVFCKITSDQVKYDVVGSYGMLMELVH